MWKELHEIATNLRYIEARCSLGQHQAHALCHDLDFLVTQSDGVREWIKTDFLNVKDCLVSSSSSVSGFWHSTPNPQLHSTLDARQRV